MDNKIFVCLLFLCLAECSKLVSRADNLKSKTRVRSGKYSRGEVLENLFNIYDPSFLAIVWPKITNGVHLAVENVCWVDVSALYKDLSVGRVWAYAVADASGRYQSGIFSGNRFWLGSKEQCLQLDNSFVASGSNETLDEYYSSKYLNSVLRMENHFDSNFEDVEQSRARRSGIIRRPGEVGSVVPPHRLSYIAVQLELNITTINLMKSFEITLGVCLPRSCTRDDIASIINFSVMINDNLKSNKTVPRTVKITSLKRIEESYDVTLDIGAIAIIFVTSFLFILAVVATVVDLDLVKCRPHISKSMSFDLPNNIKLKSKNKSSEIIRKQISEPKKEINCMKLECLPANDVILTNLKTTKVNTYPHSMTLDVKSKEKLSGSCIRCGKYRKQCVNPTQLNTSSTSRRVHCSSFISLSTVPQKRNGFFHSLLLCFSLSYSWKKIFNTNMANKDLSSIHVLRVLATFWVLFVHVAVVANFVSDNNVEVNRNYRIFHIITVGTFAFDTLIFVSGIFSSHHFFYLKSQYTVEELVNFGGICGQILQFICFVTNRAIRLLPSYIYVVFLTGVFARMSRSTSAITLPEDEHNTCNVYWWRNFLYITTFYSGYERCMQVSWYLSTETQLHAIGALVCALWMASLKYAAIALAVILMITAIATDVSAAYIEYGQYFSDVFSVYEVYIARPWARVIPYFIGVFIGWLIHRTNASLRISKVTRIFLWFISLSILLVTLIMPKISTLWMCSWLSALNHLAWILGLVWPALVCSTEHAELTHQLLSSPILASLSRLSYGMILLHGLVTRAILLDVAAALGSYALLCYFAGASLLSVLSALCLSLLVEMPCCSLLRRLSDCANNNAQLK